MSSSIASSSQNPPSANSRCNQCNASSNGRNLVVCIDGTANVLGKSNTNVVKLFAKVDRESSTPEQLAFYTSGIGTHLRSQLISQHAIRRLAGQFSGVFNKAFAWNVENNIKTAYNWVSQTYQKGDQIYLFGFSRGAYQVRVLAAMIHEVGLINMPTEKLVKTAYDNYKAVLSGKSNSKQTAAEFKAIFSRHWNVKVHFIGVWDTVSSVGLTKANISLSTSSCAEHACNFRHALALDERRVMFIPEHFHEINSLASGRKYAFTADSNCTATITSDRRQSAITYTSVKTNDKIKEVWFAGNHSDVGGKTQSGRTYQAGRVSLLWMRREAAASGLVLKPTNTSWIPGDLDFGTEDSMNDLWKIIERIPVKHQVSFSGAGEDARRRHLAKPRRVIPGQKIHASVGYANIYRPQALLGDGFDIPIIHAGLDTNVDGRFWETGLFDDTAAQELVTHLSDKQVASIYIDGLLFMLRFEEGKECIRRVECSQDRFKNLVQKPGSELLVKLIAVVAYYEVSCDSEKDHTCSPLFEDEFDTMEENIHTILSSKCHRDGPKVAALLRPLAKHQILRERILTDVVLKELMALVRKVIDPENDCFATDGYFEQLMDGLNGLLLCEGTQGTIIKELKGELLRMLQIEDTHRLTAVLRLVLTLVQIPTGKKVAKSPVYLNRLNFLASTKSPGLVSTFAVRILLSLYNQGEENHLGIHKPQVRANFAQTIICFGDNADRIREMLSKLFGINAKKLSQGQKALIRELKNAVQNGTVQERTAATLTIVALCETDAIREYLLEIRLLDDFFNQLPHKDAALLAAYALAACLKYPDMKRTIVANRRFPKGIAWMLRFDYFDDAVGSVEGFQILGDLMRHDELRRQIKIADILYDKLQTGERKKARMSLICLDILCCFDQSGPTCTGKLVDKGVECLRQPAWKDQKAGVTILASLAQTEHGVEAIGYKISEIVKMLLPEGHGQNSPAAAQVVPLRSPLGMMGPACTLRILAQREELRAKTLDAEEYQHLKRLYQSEKLISEANTKAWEVHTPNRTDVIDMLQRMIKAVDGEPLEDGLLSIGGEVLPHIKHWGRFLKFVAKMPLLVFLTLLFMPFIVILFCLVSVLFRETHDQESQGPPGSPA